MADNDWDTVTRIGSKARGPGSGGADRERVVRGNSALNAAKRSGAVVATEKKYGGANSKSGVEGQHLTKVDRSDDIIKPKLVPMTVARAISNKRAQTLDSKGKAMTQDELASKSGVNKSLLKDIEAGRAVYEVGPLRKLENFLNIQLLGGDIGSPKFGNKKKEQK
ncbi:Multiprotein-bridging factor 1 [Fonsecaea pedrosoi]|nr:Multiprotein-bridging factor 1 [Fonsecaea pedrosoi]